MQLQIGDRLELEVQSGAYLGNYPSQILNINDREMTVGVPIVRGHVIPLREGSLLRVLVLKTDAAYEFFASILRRTQEGPMGLILSLPTKLVRSQRREDVRVEVSVPVDILVYAIPGSEEWNILHGRTRDLSAGGARIEYSGELKGGEQIQILINIPGDQPMTLSCRYIRGERSNRPGKSWMALRFEGIKERDKRRILKFVFQKQQELRAKGLI